MNILRKHPVTLAVGYGESHAKGIENLKPLVRAPEWAWLVRFLTQGAREDLGLK